MPNSNRIASGLARLVGNIKFINHEKYLAAGCAWLLGGLNSISNCVVKYIKISITDSDTIKKFPMDFLYPNFFFFCSWIVAYQVCYATVHSSIFFFYYNNQVLNKKMLKDV